MNKTKIDLLKKKQRDQSVKNRITIKNSVDLKKNFFYSAINNLKWFQQSKIIGSFLSIKSEISTDGLNSFLKKTDKIICLPAIYEEDGGKIVFKRYGDDSNLIKGKFGIKEPKGSKIFLPDTLFVPCLAYDEEGFRLGYGGGYYDKFISYLISINHHFITIGFAFDDQKVDMVFHDNLDQKLNYILTEKKLYKIL